ncbi:deoxyribose-phosphate aldolase [Nakamurella aerolata]|uniref:Deoxyribose-phosphate aldolase n=1 Tax=Nakamurella aerolata TaxID=1656892 RepID=A0A849AC90_9ACTN|nr:deoxyribose-phosphate aldolase [Nakamurella aerolata]NNG36758.1 deoxyribose-phosphate aldolase [Nakamurella aerolata]
MTDRTRAATEPAPTDNTGVATAAVDPGAPDADRADAAIAELTPAQIAGRIQHTLIGQAITENEVREHVRETVKYGFDAAIVPPTWVQAARTELSGTHIRVGSIIDFPYGMMTTAGRVAEAKALVDAGVDELDATVNIALLLSHRIDRFVEDLRALVQAAAPIGVKVMLELPLLNQDQRVRVVQAAVDAGVAFVKNASRGAVGIADPASISFLRRSVPPSIGVKASGGIKTIEQVRALLAAGADLIGTSSGVAIVGGDATARGSLYSY